MVKTQETKQDEREKTCFVVCPIGNAESKTRNRSDMVLRFIVDEVLGKPPFNYRIERADNIPDPGNISDQIINKTISADLVVADLSDHNPNAFYELGLRHMSGRPTIHMIEEGQKIPFDNIDFRTIFYRVDSPEKIDAAIAELHSKVEAIHREDFEVANPVTRAVGKKDLALHGDSRDKIISDLVDEIGLLNRRFDAFERESRPKKRTTFTTDNSEIPSDLVKALMRPETDFHESRQMFLSDLLKHIDKDRPSSHTIKPEDLAPSLAQSGDKTENDKQ